MLSLLQVSDLTLLVSLRAPMVLHGLSVIILLLIGISFWRIHVLVERLLLAALQGQANLLLSIVELVLLLLER